MHLLGSALTGEAKLPTGTVKPRAQGAAASMASRATQRSWRGKPACEKDPSEGDKENTGHVTVQRET
jgi:hypothetical protein